MNKNEISPFVRFARFSILQAPFRIEKRAIFDYELILVSDGKCKITIGDTEYLCKKNDVVFLRPGIHHKFECVGNIDFHQPHIHFDMAYSDLSEKRFISFKPKSEMSAGELALIHEDIFKDIPVPDVFIPFDADSFRRNFFEIIELFQKKEYNHELLCKAKMLCLLDSILTQFDVGSRSAKPDNPIIAVKNYIDGNFRSVITLESVSKQFHLNKYTLLRKFKAMYHQNIISYYHSKRIDYIKTALKTTTLSVTAIAEKLNFSDIYSFSRFFKSNVGCSPTDYRKKHISE